jgi:hypothetical protein
MGGSARAVASQVRKSGLALPQPDSTIRQDIACAQAIHSIDMERRVLNVHQGACCTSDISRGMSPREQAVYETERAWLEMSQALEYGGGGRDRTGVNGFAGRCITTLLPRQGKGIVTTKSKPCCARMDRSGLPAMRRLHRLFSKSGAGEESRTLDLNLGKVALYQLSYSRVDCMNTVSACSGGDFASPH